ncbi:MAG: recombinase family protein [Coprobacillus sp.]
MEGKKYGYIWVSSKDQNITRQVMAIEEVGISERNVFIDKQLGKDSDRPMYKKLLKKFKKRGCIVY